MTASAYDEKDYPYAARPFTHPARLGVVATLFGRPCAPFENCRVLEIGGGDGVNVISMALGAPHSQFVNFDLSVNAIAQGERLASACGARNVRQEARDVLEAGDSLGTFDYIIAHGVYAWVPPPVRAELMGLVGRLLSPRGVAMLSYNALPGCHIRRATRDLAYQAASRHSQAEARVAAARAALQFHCARWSAEDPAQNAMRLEAEHTLKRPDGVIFHDELCDDWHPQFVRDVASAARANGLDYLGDMQAALIDDALFPGALAREAAGMTGGDYAEYEQIKDFADGRAFRQTLLCRAGAPVDRAFDPSRMSGLWVDGRFEISHAGGADPIAFRAANGGAGTTDNRMLANILMKISQAWPAAVRVDELTMDGDAREALARLFASGAVGLSAAPFPVCANPGERPQASVLARVQAASGLQGLTTLRHTHALIEDARMRAFLVSLDGTRTREQLIEETMAQGEGREQAAAKVHAALQALTNLGLMSA